MITLKYILNKYKKTYADPETVSDEKLFKDIKSDYKNIVDLRKRIHESTDGEPPKLYEEDSIILDHVLDFLEILIGAIKPKQSKFDFLETYRELYDNGYDAVKLYMACELEAHDELYASDKMIECLRYLWVNEYNIPIVELADALSSCCEYEYKSKPNLLLRDFDYNYERFKEKYEGYLDI